MLTAAVCTLHSCTLPAQTSLRPWRRAPAENQAAPRAAAARSGAMARKECRRPVRDAESAAVPASATTGRTRMVAGLLSHCLSNQPGSGWDRDRATARSGRRGIMGFEGPCLCTVHLHAAPETRGRVRPGLGWPPPGPALSSVRGQLEASGRGLSAAEFALLVSVGCCQCTPFMLSCVSPTRRGPPAAGIAASGRGDLAAGRVPGWTRSGRIPALTRRPDDPAAR